MPPEADTTAAIPTATAGSPTVAPASAAPNGANGAASAPWYSGFENPDTRGYTELKGFKGPEAAMESYRNLEKMQGVPIERLLKLPEKMDKLEELHPIFDRLGRPAKPEEYGLKVPDGQPDDFAKEMAPILHQAGLTKMQATVLNEAWNAYQTRAYENFMQAEQTKAQLDLSALHKEWPGEVYQQREELGRRAAREFGLDVDTLGKVEDALGTAATMRLFASIGEKLGEASFDTGAHGGDRSFGMTPDAARVKKEELMSDREWAKRYNAGGKTEMAELRRLQEVINQGVEVQR